MPLVRIDPIEGRPDTELGAIADAVLLALGECLGVPERDHFLVVTTHPPARLVYDRAYLGVERTAGVVFVQVWK